MYYLKSFTLLSCLFLLFSCSHEDSQESYEEVISSTRAVGCDMVFDEVNCILHIDCLGQGIITFHDGQGNEVQFPSPYSTIGGFPIPVKQGETLYVAPNGIGGPDERSFTCNQ